MCSVHVLALANGFPHTVRVALPWCSGWYNSTRGAASRHSPGDATDSIWTRLIRLPVFVHFVQHLRIPILLSHGAKSNLSATCRRVWQRTRALQQDPRRPRSDPGLGRIKCAQSCLACVTPWITCEFFSV